MTKYEQSNSAAVHFSIPVGSLLRPLAGGEVFVQQVVGFVGILAGKFGAGAPLGQFDYSVEHLFQVLVVRNISL